MEVQAWMLALLVIFSIVSIFTAIPRNVAVAVQWWFRCVAFFLFSNEAKKRPKPALRTVRNKKVRVIFVRHGESVWNALFNRFGLTWPLRVARYGFEMIFTVLGHRHDSVIIDSPLSQKGEQQAAELERYVKSAITTREIPTDPRTSVIVSSNLRRAMATGLVGFDPRLRMNPGEKILIDSALQEGSRNADAQSFMLHRGRLADSPVLGYQTAAEIGKLFDPSFSLGNKKRSSANVFTRIDAFAARLLGEGPDGLSNFAVGAAKDAPDCVIVVGHSLWFKNFFNRFLPPSSTHVAKRKKMHNCAVVSFDLIADGQGEIRIDEASITAMHLGFHS